MGMSATESDALQHVLDWQRIINFPLLTVLL